MTLKPGALLALNMAWRDMNPCDRRDMIKRRYPVKLIHRETIKFTDKDFAYVLCGLDKGEILK
jgi:hypothetical protein